MRIIFFAILFSLSAGSVHGHQCVLSGTGASEIAIYNACKNDLVMGMDGHGSSATSAASATDQVSQKLILLAENSSCRRSCFASQPPAGFDEGSLSQGALIWMTAEKTCPLKGRATRPNSREVQLRNLIDSNNSNLEDKLAAENADPR